MPTYCDNPQKIPVDVFALNWIVGQNTISHDGHGNWGTQFEDRRVLLTDRETLLSLDVASTKPAEITIYATVDGVEVYREIHSLQRYYGNLRRPDRHQLHRQHRASPGERR